jgi:hypothetical protein
MKIIHTDLGINHIMVHIMNQDTMAFIIHIIDIIKNKIIPLLCKGFFMIFIININYEKIYLETGLT